MREYGGNRIRADIIESAESLIRELPANLTLEANVVPMSNGCLQLEWHRGDKSLELKFESADELRYLKWEPSIGVDEEETIRVRPVDKIAELIPWFMSGTKTC